MINPMTPAVQKIVKHMINISQYSLQALRKKCPNTELFLVRIFMYSDWIWRLARKSSYSLQIQENMDQK